MTERGTHSDQLILHLQTLKHCDWRLKNQQLEPKNKPVPIRIARRWN